MEQALLAVPVVLMVGVSLWGAMGVPTDARFRGRFGGLGHEFTVAKTTALVMWPLFGAIVWFGMLLLDEEPGALIWLSLVGLLIMLGAHVAAVSAARNR